MLKIEKKQTNKKKTFYYCVNYREQNSISAYIFCEKVKYIKSNTNVIVNGALPILTSLGNSQVRCYVKEL